MARKKPAEDEGGGYNWMDTYGDLVTLLLCFFVLLFSFSNIDAQKAAELLAAFQGSTPMVIQALDVESAIEKPITMIPTTSGEADTSGLSPEELEAIEEAAEIRRQENENFEQLVLSITEYVETNNLGVDIQSDFESYTIVIRFLENVLFDSGRANLLPESLEVLDHIINALVINRDLYEMIRIEGHTDNRPIHNSQFEDNWDLSSKRAGNVLRYLLDSGRLDDTKISTVGYGEKHPVMPNDTAEGRAANRRVDFVVEGIKTR